MDKNTDPTNPTDEEVAEFKALMEHPWVQPALQGMEPGVVPASIKLEPVVIQTTEEEKTVETNAALLTIVDLTGIKTVYIAPSSVEKLMATSAAMLQAWSEEAPKGLIIPNGNIEREAKRMMETQTHLRRV